MLIFLVFYKILLTLLLNCTLEYSSFSKTFTNNHYVLIFTLILFTTLILFIIGVYKSVFISGVDIETTNEYLILWSQRPK